MKIEIKTLSPLLSASGESTAQLDADVKYDRYGFPYIQAKTFKGLLRESAIEVWEILFYKKDNNDNYTVVEELFGKTGCKDSGTLSFNNLKIKGYSDFDQELMEYNNILNPNLVKKQFTELRQQTTIENGTAKDKSLWKYRLIKEGIEFETIIDNDNITIEQEKFLKKALLNLRYMGTRRNRGFGKIKINIINENGGKENNVTSEANINATVNNNKLVKLSFDITTLDTLLIAKIFGEQNTVSTEQFIPAQNIRGLISGLIIKNKNISKEVHKDKSFKSIILDGDIKFSNAFIKGSEPVPIIYGYDKTKPDSLAEFIFDKQNPLKQMNGYAKFSDKEINTIEVETTFSFHSSRFENRLAGRSTKEEGAIFYYEGIAPNQTFSGEIIGNDADLIYIQSLLQQNDGVHRIGKSKTAQYSKVKFSDLIKAEIKSDEVNEVKSPAFIVFQSPVITYNEFGLAVPDKLVLENELKSYCESAKIIAIASSANMVENYMGVWQSKTPREVAFDIGTTLKIEFSGTFNKNELEIAGLGERINEGYGRIRIINLIDGLSRIDDYNNQNEQLNEVVLNPFTKEPLKTLFEQQAKEKALNNLKILAIEKAKNYQLPSSLISRLKDELLKATEEGWRRFMKDIEGKKAHKTLNEAGLWENVFNLDIPNVIQNPTYETKKEYWLTFFKTLRIKQNKHRKNGK